jgi:CcmD family protein
MLAVLVVALVLAAVPMEVLAAQAGVAPTREMRHFWHVFIAYAIAWALVFGWLVSILRRLKRVEEKLGGER